MLVLSILIGIMSSIYPDYFEAYNDRGSAYNLIRKSNNAIADFKKALQINPNYGLAQKNAELMKQYKAERFNRILGLITSGLNIASGTLNVVSSVNNLTTKAPSSVPTIKTNAPANTPQLKSNKQLCTWCNGTGVCDFCNSQGQSKTCLTYTMGVICTDRWCAEHGHKCKQCRGTRICSNCNGKKFK
jgi:hypothetical protein